MTLYTSDIGKVYVLIFAACGVMFNILGARIRANRKRRARAAEQARKSERLDMHELEEAVRRSRRGGMRRVRKVLMIILLIVFLASAGGVGYIMWQYKMSDDTYSQAARSFTRVNTAANAAAGTGSADSSADVSDDTAADAGRQGDGDASTVPDSPETADGNDDENFDNSYTDEPEVYDDWSGDNDWTDSTENDWDGDHAWTDDTGDNWSDDTDGAEGGLIYDDGYDPTFAGEGDGLYAEDRNLPEDEAGMMSVKRSLRDTAYKLSISKEIAPISVDFDALLDLNDDIIGWIYCEGTMINYPVLHGETNDTYLRHSYDKSYNVAGSVFIDADNDTKFEDYNTIVYGHHMQNGSMFAGLDKWEEQDYYDEHPYMWLLTPEQDYKVLLVAGYTISAFADTYSIFQEPGAAFSKYLREAVKKSDFKAHSFVDPDGHYVLLSTCAYVFDYARYVIHGLLVPAGSAGGVPLSELPVLEEAATEVQPD